MEDAVIVGAGPAGNGVALELAKAGLQVTVVDYRTVLGDKLCTGIVSAQCLHDFPSTKEVVLRACSSATVVSPSGIRLSIRRGAPQAYVIDRVAYVTDLADQAQRAGATYLLGRRVTGIQRTSQGMRVTLNASAEPSSIDAKVVVIASGFSGLPARLGLSKLRDYVVGAQIEVSAPRVDEIQIYVGKNVAPGFFGWVTPTVGGKAFLGVLARSNASAHAQSLLASLRADGTVAETTGVMRRWGVPLRFLESTVTDGVVVVGDAAGQVKPTTGGGIYYALLASRLAASAIKQAIAANDCSAARLGVYNRQWRALLAKELEAGSRLRSIGERLSDWQLDQIIGAVRANGFLRELLAGSDTSFDWHGHLAQRVLGFSSITESLKCAGFTDIWRRLSRTRAVVS